MTQHDFQRRPVGEHRDAVARLVAAIPRRTARYPVADLGAGPALTLARDLLTPEDLPPFDNSQMDGFAVRTTDLTGGPTRLRVVGHVAAGSDAGHLHPGEAVPVMTGAPLPDGADAVVPVEESGLRRFPRPGEEVSITVAPQQPGRFVRRAGSDAAAGDVLLPAHSPLTPAAVGAIASAGLDDVDVVEPLRVLVVATGSEVRSPGEPGRRASVRDANTPGLCAAVTAAGAVAVAGPVVPDDPEALVAALAAHLGSVDMVVTAGGVSAGSHEVVKEALAPLGVAFGSVAIQPGGPQGLGTARLPGGHLPVVALPGNPVSALVSAEVFLRPALRARGGRSPDRVLVTAPLAEGASSPPGRLQLRRGTPTGDGTIAFVGGPSSHLLASYARARLLVAIPPQTTTLRAGDTVTAWRIDD